MTIPTKGAAKKLYVKLSLKAPATTGFEEYAYSKPWRVKRRGA